MKEMVGGCCVCSDERGWPENPLVYCDGQNCTVAVHQACYGIVTVPTGPWYCRKCESQERAARVRCELCPSRDGALKKTDNHGWAHVVCALYIPEVRFGNVTTMEPIILQLIPHERYSKTCYICQEIGKGSKAHVGACMQCNKAGCKQQFHVTCAQGLGLLCEEAGNYLDNVKYCGYCQHHYSKLKKGGNVKTIPPYKPVTNEAGSSDPPSSPEKESESLPPSHHNTASTSASLKAITSSSSSSITHLNLTQSSSVSASSSTTTNTSSSFPTGTHVSGSGSTATSSSASSTKLRKSGGSGGSSSKSSSGPSSGSVATNLPASSPNAQNVSSGHGNTSSSARSQLSSSSGNKDKESSKYNKNPSKTSSSKSHDKETREKSSKSSSSSKGSHKENSSMDTPPVVPPIIVSTAMLSGSKDSAIPTTMTSTKESMAQKFTTSNFTETMVVNSESVFGSENPTTKSATSTNVAVAGSSSSSSSTGGATISVAKKRKVDVSKLSSLSGEQEINKDLIKDVSVTLVPLPAMDRMELVDEKSSKKQKTESTPTVSPLRIVHEPNLQNVSPNLPNSSGSQKHQVIVGQASGSSSGSTYSIQPALSKLSANDSRLHQSNQQHLASTISSSQNNIGSSQQPSLVVSVPLSNATGPGVHLPLNTSATIVQVNHQPQQPPSQHYSQRLSSGEISNQHRHSPSVPSNHTISPQQQPQPQQHQSVLQNHHQSKGRHSPAVHPSSNSQFPHVPTSLSSSSPSSHSMANITPVPSDHFSPISVLQSPSGGTTPMDTDSAVLKISYEKQPNSRIIQLQDDSTAGRRSRSQSGSEISTKTRNSKKRSAPSSSGSPSTSSAFYASASYHQSNTPQSNLTNLPPLTTNNNTTSTTSSSSPYHHHHPPPTSSSSSSTTSASITRNISAKRSHSSSSSSANGATANGGGSDTIHPNHPLYNNTPFMVAAASSPSTADAAASVAPSSQTTKPAKTVHHKKSRTVSIDSTPSTSSRTPDNVYSANASSASANSSFGGLKFGYEAQTPSASIAATASSANVTPSVTPQPQAIKDSPPSSPGSEAGSSRKRNRLSTDTKDFKIFQNGVHVTHMLGNQLNPSSSVAQKMSDQLHMELEAHSVYTSSSMDSASQLIGPPFPGKQQALNRASAGTSSQSQGPPSLTSMLGGNGTPTAAGNTPQSLEQLLERQWEQGSQFLMEQAQHFDIASLLSCLHQLRTENVRLEDHVTNLVARRDHLLAVNARLAIPLNPPVPQTPQGNQFNNIHMNGPINEMSSHSGPGVPSNRSNNPNQQQQSQRSGGAPQHGFIQQSHPMQQQQQQQHQPMENGIDFRHGPTPGHQMSSGIASSGGVPSSSRQSASHIQPQQHLYTNQPNTNSMVGGARQHPQHQQPQSHHPQQLQSSSHSISSNSGPPLTDPNQMRGRIGSASACSTQQLQQLPPSGYSNQPPSHQHQSNRRGDDGSVKPS